MAAKVPGGANQRLYLLAAVCALWIAIIGCRLVQLQVFRYGELTQRAARQQLRSIEVAPRRGNIYDRNGNELAMSINVDSVFAVPQEIANPVAAATLLGKVLNKDPREILTRLKSSRAFAWVERKVDAQTSDRIRKLNLRGIYFQKEPKRFYPKRDLAAQVLGYVGMDDEGLGGIERVYDEQLRGKPGTMLITQDARRRWFGSVERQPEPGENVVLTLDEKIQYIAERELETALRESGAQAGTIIVLNPGSGEVLALANRPTFNPNRFHSASPALLKNPAVSDIFEPGSTFKVVLFSGALEERLTTPEEPIDCQMGTMLVGNITIRDYKKFPVLPLEKVVAHSSGIGAIKIGLRLGDERMEQYIRAFGFGSPTGIELPGETRGLTKPASTWSRMSLIGMSRGYEVGVSPLQMAAMVSTIANNGVYIPPRIVAGTTSPSSTPQTVTFHPAAQRRVISGHSAVQMKRMMETAVLFGTGRRAILNGYTSAGKTGTAQKVDPRTGAYHPWKHVASFVGFAPVNRPAIAMVVVIDSARRGTHQGGQVAAPVFRRVAQEVLAYLNVPQDVEPHTPKARLMLASSRVSNHELADDDVGPVTPGIAIAEADTDATGTPGTQAASRSPEAAEPERGPAAMPPAPAPVRTPLARGTVIVDVEGGVEVPSFLGKSLRSVIEDAQRAGVEVDVVGSGIVREQSPPPGARISSGGRVAVRLAR